MRSLSRCCTNIAIHLQGQCTALRMLVAPKCDKQKLGAIFEPLTKIDSPLEALKDGTCFGILSQNTSTPSESEGYQRHSKLPVHFRIQDELPSSLNEEWRNVILDVTTVDDAQELDSDAKIETIPGVCSAMAIASALKIPLTVNRQKLIVLPAIYSVQELETALDLAEVVILLKVSSVYKEVWHILLSRNLLGSSANV